MSEPTMSERILAALEANQVALDALLAANAEAGTWNAQGDIYLNGHKIIGGSATDETVDKTVEIEGEVILLSPDPAAGYVRVPGALTPQLKRSMLTSSQTLTLADDGTLFVAKHDDDEDDITLTLPEITDEYDDEDTEIVTGSTWYCQAFLAGSGVLTFAVQGTNSFLTAGTSSFDPITVTPGKAAVAVYLGAGQWGVF